jgi:hypothetical protein
MVSVLVLIATEIFIQSIKGMKVQKIFQGTFELFSIMGKVLYLVGRLLNTFIPE